MTSFLPAPDENVAVGVLRVVLRMPGSRSLKDRRRVVASVRDRVVARHRVSVADVGHLEAHDAAVMAFSAVGHDPRQVQSLLDAVRADVLATADALVTDSQLDVHTWPALTPAGPPRR